MEKLSREQILDLLARAEAELLRIRISRQPQLLKKPLGLLRKADNACSDVLPRHVYESKCKQFLLTLSQAIEQAINTDDRKNLKEITELAASILNQLYTNLKDEPALSRLARQKKEIVFLPYKASMWDSLESIWKAAVDDPEHCHSYVVPIPYADRNPDGTAKEWHNERNLFPSYVPTLDCETFDLEALHPDVIFIHNPYDSCNIVTSVDSRFYSDKLKKYTDKLVYVPYFTLGEPQLDYDDPEKKDEVEKAEEKIAHFITTPGVLNANLTIVQSEAMKKVYVNVLNRHTNAPEGYWEEHILGLGSPKFDKVAGSRKEDFELPETWKKIIRGRKVVLYNTGLTAMLKYTDKYLEKVKYVLDTFKAQQDVVVWWRPHPLLRPTFGSMHPELLEEFDEIVSIYRREKWGIYDDTAELERAVAWTDGYYGDGSSVVQLYEKIKKPIMIQQMQLMSLGIADVVEFQDNLIFPAFNVNGLFMYNMKNNKLIRIAVFEEYSYITGYPLEIFYRVMLVNQDVFLFPYFGKDIYSYNLMTNHIKKIRLSSPSLEIGGTLKRFLPVWINDSFWIIRGKGGDILQINRDGKVIKFYHNWQKNIISEDLLAISDTFFTEPVSDGFFLWFAISQTNCVIQFSMKEGKAKLFRIGNGSFISLAFDGNKIWLYTEKTDLYWLDVNTHEDGFIANVLSIKENNRGNTILYRDGMIYAFSEYNTDYAMIDIERFTVSFQRVYIKNCIRTSVKMANKNIFILPIEGNSVVKIPPYGEPKAYSLFLSKKDEDFYKKTELDKLSVCEIAESSFCKLKDFIEADFLCCESEHNDKCLEIGKEILNNAKEVM